MNLDLDADLVERAVGLCAAAIPEYQREREAVYAIGEPEARDRAFADVHARWGNRLDVAGPIRRALAELPSIGAGLDRCHVRMAIFARDEGAELYAGDAGRWLVVRLRPETLADGARTVAVLRGDLVFVADMLDPAFGYEPRLDADGPDLVRMTERYVAAWAVTVAARLTRAGKVDESARSSAAHDFARAFPALAEAPEVFLRLWNANRPTHAEIAALARDHGGGTRCPLCQLPSRDLVGVDETAAPLIARDFPKRDLAEPVCRQCLDLYRSRVA